MLKIVKSLFAIVAVAAIGAGATSAYFSDTATITGNTFSTGTLEIRVNGQPSVVGATFSPMAPGQIGTSPRYDVNNFGQPWFVGPSTLSAKELAITIANPNDYGSGLWNNVILTVQVSRDSGATWHNAYDGVISGLYGSTADLLGPVGYAELIPGSSVSMRYMVVLPDSGGDQSALMGRTLTWDFAIEGRTN